jgi:hypothetical protein
MKNDGALFRFVRCSYSPIAPMVALLKEINMYMVTFRGAPVDNSPFAIDTVPGDLEATLTHACQLLADGKLEVAIQNGSGKHISGEVLAACCRGDKKISDALFSK